MANGPERIAKLLKTLSPIQEKVVRLYFGLGCQRSHSAAEIAPEFRVSVEVIEKILSEAERKLAEAGLAREELWAAASLGSKLALRMPRCRHWFGMGRHR